jgi:hypothetical protein
VVHPLDEYAVHQVPLSMSYVATSDRNAYDRCILHGIDPSGESLLVVGLGVYPNLGVVDGFASFRRGDGQVSVRASAALGEERMHLAVGPLRVDVVEPLRRLRVCCEHDDLAFDLEWSASSPAFEEPLHVMRDGTGRVILEGCRFAQTGTWVGTVRVGTDDVDPTGWVGTRDRSWGIRPVGEAEPAGRPQDRQGFWWVWSPLRFDDFTVMTILQEEPDGFRTMNEALRVWHDGRRTEQLGWPEVDIRYRPGTRHPEGATLRYRGGFSVDVETLTSVSLNVGCGYGGDPEWAHGQWRGESWVEAVSYDLTDEAVRARTAFSVVEHAARATTSDGDVGHGLFEHASMGRHDPTGFADWFSVAPG